MILGVAAVAQLCPLQEEAVKEAQILSSLQHPPEAQINLEGQM